MSVASARSRRKKGFGRMTHRRVFLSLAVALSLSWFGRLALAGMAGYIDTYVGEGPPLDSFATAVSVTATYLTINKAGEVYFSTANDQIWRLNADGKLTLIAGTGLDGYAEDGSIATSVQLYTEGIAFDSNGNLYVADATHQRIRKVDLTTGILTTVAGGGGWGYSGDGSIATSARLNFPRKVAFDSHDNFYIADAGNHTVRKVDHASGIITTVAGTGNPGYSGDGGSAISAQINAPVGLALDSSDNLYIADTGNNRIRKVDHVIGMITTVAGTGEGGYSGDGFLAIHSQLGKPRDVALDSSGNLFIVDDENRRIRRIDHATGIITTVAGTGGDGDLGDGGPATSAHLYDPFDMAVDAYGNLYISDLADNRLRKVDRKTGIISTIAGNGSPSYSGDGGAAISAQIDHPFDVAVDASGNLYIADFMNYRVRKVDASTGLITTIAGTGYPDDPGDGVSAISANISYPTGLTFDTAGNLYIADWGHCEIHKVNFLTGIISSVAGMWYPGYAGDGGTATSAYLQSPNGMAVDSNGDLYIADTDNNVIRKVDSVSGIITTVAGTGGRGYAGDGAAANHAFFNHPKGVAFDASGNLYIADTENNVIRKVEHSTNIISTVAGTVAAGFSGDGLRADSAQLNQPKCIVFDANGSLYIADYNNNRIRKVDSAGIITTIAGTRSNVFSGDGGPAIFASLYGPLGMAFDADGNLYVADQNHSRIRIIYQVGADKVNPKLSVSYGTDYQGIGSSYLRIDAQDAGSGFGGFFLTQASNLREPIYQEKVSDDIIASGASLGTTNPVSLYLVKSDRANPASLSFSVSDQAGNVESPSQVIFLPFAATGTLAHAFASMAKDQGIVSILAGDGDLRSVSVTANGEKVAVGDVPAAEVRTVDLRSRLSDGSDNEIDVQAEGDAGTEACILVSSAALSMVKEMEETGKRILRRGDMNEDGRINVRDATILLRILTGITTANSIERSLGDMNLDGRLNVSDGVALLKAIVGG